jgi:hypothetical protein
MGPLVRWVLEKTAEAAETAAASDLIHPAWSQGLQGFSRLLTLFGSASA